MLDPTRLKLGAESVGYLARFGLPIEWTQFDKALQTDYNNQGSAVQVRRERETPRDEIHVMGGGMSGAENNSLVLTQDRQLRQINGYPLRQFSAENPAVVIPRKYGGLPMYTRNQVEYDQYVSRFTEPLSAQLDSRTELLGRAGLPALTEDINRPFDAPQFINPMTSTKDELDQNQNVFRQRLHLQKMARKAWHNKVKFTPNMSSYNMFYTASKQNMLINKDGTPMSNAADEEESEMATRSMLEGGPDIKRSKGSRGYIHSKSRQFARLYEERRQGILDRKYREGQKMVMLRQQGDLGMRPNDPLVTQEGYEVQETPKASLPTVTGTPSPDDLKAIHHHMKAIQSPKGSMKERYHQSRLANFGSVGESIMDDITKQTGRVSQAAYNAGTTGFEILSPSPSAMQVLRNSPHAPVYPNLPEVTKKKKAGFTSPKNYSNKF